MLGFAPIASVPLSALPGINLYPFTLTNTNYLYDLVIGVGPVSIEIPTLTAESILYQITVGFGLITIYPNTIVNSNNVYGVITFVFDKPATVFKTNIVVAKEPYNVVVASSSNNVVNLNAFVLE